jgi:hypothetical protein
MNDSRRTTVFRTRTLQSSRTLTHLPSCHRSQAPVFIVNGKTEEPWHSTAQEIP